MVRSSCWWSDGGGGGGGGGGGSESSSSSSSSSSSWWWVGMVLQVWQEWQITILLILGVGLQLLLVIMGFFRERVLSRSFHALVWVAYLGLEASCVYSLSLMLGSGCDHIFSMWAPLVLFHMGVADAINAYAPADNELWRRSVFKLLLSVIATLFIMSRAQQCHRYLLASVLLAILGCFKSVERVFALYKGSTNQILVAARPIYHFMALDEESIALGDFIEAQDDPRYLLVAGEWQWYRYHRSKQSPHSNCTYYVKQLLCDYAGYRTNPAMDWKQYVVSLSDIEQEGAFDGHHHEEINELCLAYALSKIYRRRLSNLRIHFKVGDYSKVRNILLNSYTDHMKLIRVIDLEMSFIFDGIFTKAAGGEIFQGIGMLTRILSVMILLTVLMDLACVRILDVACVSASSDSVSVAGANGPVEGLTFLFLIVAVAVECLQIHRHVRCNPFRVWLAYTYIRQKRILKSQGILHCIKETGQPQPQPPHQTRRRQRRRMMTDSLSRFSMGVILALLDYGSTTIPKSRLSYIIINKEWILALLNYFGASSGHYILDRSSDGKHRDYNNIGQCSILADTMGRLSWHYFLSFRFDLMKKARQKQREIQDLFAVTSVTDLEELQKFVIEELEKMFEDVKMKQDSAADLILHGRPNNNNNNNNNQSYSYYNQRQDPAQKVRENVAKTVKMPFNDDDDDGDEEEEEERWTAFTALEELVLHCHLATSVCELQILREVRRHKNKKRDREASMPMADVVDNRRMKMSVWLSRYCVFLMLKRHSLIPEDPDLAKTLYARHKRRLKEMCVREIEKKEVAAAAAAAAGTGGEEWVEEAIEDGVMGMGMGMGMGSEDVDMEKKKKKKKKKRKSSSSSSSSSRRRLELGIWRGNVLLQQPQQRRESRLCRVWVHIIIFMAAAGAEKNASPHMEQMGRGGGSAELLTRLWLLLGHLGLGPL